MDLEGSVVEYVDSGALRLGYVRRLEQRKAHIVDPRGRQSTVPTSRVVVIHERIPEEEFPNAADRIRERVASRISEIDTGLLWESVRTDGRRFTLSELAEAYFGHASADCESALYRRLSEDTLFFRRVPGGFETRSERQVSAERLRIAREAQRESDRQEVTRLLRLALEHETADMSGEPGWTEVLGRLERWFRNNDTDGAGTALEKIVGETNSRQVAYEILFRFGQIGSEEDRFLLVHGLPTQFPKDVLEASQRLATQPDLTTRTLIDTHDAFAIDDEHTVEIDDALTVTEDGDDTVVGIHIADVASIVLKDDPLDREAHRRSSTIYLPNVSVMMFPPRLSTNIASLVTGAPRAALSVEARFSGDGELRDCRFFRSVITVFERMDYPGADRALAAGHRGLRRLHRIASALNDERVSRGAQTHRRPDIKVHVTDSDIRVLRLEANTPARLIVSEMMILANHLAATHAANTGIPIIFRTQDPPTERPPDTNGLPEAIQFELLRRSFKRSRLSLHPSPHAGLGLTCYTQMSSPLRRYADLVTQRQFVAALEGRELPYQRDELLEVLTSCEAREIEIRRLEQTSTAWWILTYLSRECLGRPLEAVVVDGKGTVELSDFLVRARLKDREDLSPGDVVTVRLESVDPEHGSVRLASPA